MGCCKLFYNMKRRRNLTLINRSRNFKFQLNLGQEEIDINAKPTKAARNIKKKAKNASLEDMKKGWKPLYGKYTLRNDNADVDRATTHQRLSSSSLKGETESFILAAQDHTSTYIYHASSWKYQSRILNNGADPNYRYAQRDRKQ